MPGCGEDLKIQIWSQVKQGITVLGTPLGNVAFVEFELEMKVAQQRTLLERIPAVPDQRGSFSCTVPQLGRIICCG